MKINVSNSIKDFNGKPIISTKEVMLYDKEKNQPVVDDKGKPVIVTIEEGEPVTFKDIFEKVLISTTEKDDAEKKLKMYKLLSKISTTKKEVDIDIEEAALLNNLCKERLANVLVIGRIDELLNGK